MLNEINQTEKDKYCMISFICGIRKYNKLVNITKKSKLTDIENKQVVTSGWVGGGGRRSNIGVGEQEVQTTGFKIGLNNVLYNMGNIVHILQ